MNRETRPFLVALAVVIAAGVLLLVVWPRVERTLSPQLLRAWVAVQPEGESAARSGLVEIPADAPFQLHAVLEARSPSGEPIFYSDATALVLDGQTIPSASIRPWDRDRRANVLWFTVEGFTAFYRIDDAEQLGKMRLNEIYRSDWPRAWSIPGVVAPRLDDPLEEEGLTPTFGTQRLHVRIELYADDKTLISEQRFRSPGAESWPDQLDAVTTVVATLPGPLTVPSAAFGLTQIEVAESAGDEAATAIDELWGRRVAFESVQLLREVVAREAGEIEQLSWQTVDVSAGERRWQWEVAAGDLLRVGKRVVFLRGDDGDGVLDPDDLCLDFEGGAALRRLADVFSGGGVVEWASLASPEG